LPENFETASRQRDADPARLSSSGFFARHKAQIAVSVLVMLVLVGGAYYSSRASETAPKTVYSTSLEEAKNEAQTPLLVNINTADAKELDELPGVGPSTAKSIVEHRRHRGYFKSVSELSSVQNYENRELGFRALLADGRQDVRFERVTTNS
jgi:competence protein ComEA